MSDDYIPWWVPADDPRRRGVVPAAEVVAPVVPKPAAKPVVKAVVAKPIVAAPDPAGVLVEPTTPAQVVAARDYIASQGSE